MFDWKIIITVIAVIIILFSGLFASFGLGEFKRIGDFFKPLTDKISEFFGSPVPQIDKNVSFSFQGNYEEFSTDVTANISIVMSNAQLKTSSGTFDISDFIYIENFDGLIEVKGNSIHLQGNFKSVKSDKISLNVGKIESLTTEFDSLNIVGELKEITLSGDSIIVEDMKYEIKNKKVMLSNADGSFAFTKNLTCNGFANKISIKNGISITISS